MTKVVDSYRYIGGVTRRMVQTWIKLEPEREIPWQPLTKPLSDCTVALLSSGGIALKTDEPFDQAGECENPWWGDPSYRKIPRTTQTEDIRVWHQHIDPTLGESDINCLLPIERLNELERLGKIGRSADTHYSTMGYVLNPTELLEQSVPDIINSLAADAVDLVVLVPA